MDGVTRRSQAASASSAPQPAPAEQSPVTPVKSAKDAINAMYAADPSKRLSQYLATSAKDIINASADNKASGSRSAASLHHSSSQRRLKSVRPSASAIFNNSAADESTVVRTSLKLKPQKATSSRSTRKKISLDDAISELASSPQPAPRSSSPIDQIRPAQPNIAHAPQSTATTSAALTSTPQPVQSVPHPAQSTSSSSARPAAGRRFMQDVIRSPRATTSAQNAQSAQPARPISDINITNAASSQNPPHVHVARPPRSNRPANSLDGTLPRPRAPHSPQGSATAPHASQSNSSTISAAASTANITSAINAANAAVNAMTDAAAASDAAKQKTKSRSIESIKNRFRPKNKNTDRPKKHRAEDFLQPSYADTPAVPTHTTANTPPNAPVNVEPPKEAVHIYGMSPEPELPAAAPTWVQADQTSSAGEVELGVIEDFSPNSVPTSADPGETAKVTPHGPDVLGGDSPFFLKSVSVEKRPLSDAPPRRNPQAEGATRVAPSFNSSNSTSFTSFSNLANLEDSAPDTPSETIKKDKKSKAKSAKTTKTPKNAKSPKSAKPAKSPKSPKSAKTSRRDLEPTVIIPQHSGSHTTIIILLILTVIVGALVGAATYLFLFQ